MSNPARLGILSPVGSEFTSRTIALLEFAASCFQIVSETRSDKACREMTHSSVVIPLSGITRAVLEIREAGSGYSAINEYLSPTPNTSRYLLRPVSSDGCHSSNCLLAAPISSVESRASSSSFAGRGRPKKTMRSDKDATPPALSLIGDFSDLPVNQWAKEP